MDNVMTRLNNAPPTRIKVKVKDKTKPSEKPAIVMCKSCDSRKAYDDPSAYMEGGRFFCSTVCAEKYLEKTFKTVPGPSVPCPNCKVNVLLYAGDGVHGDLGKYCSEECLQANPVERTGDTAQKITFPKCETCGKEVNTLTRVINDRGSFCNLFCSGMGSKTKPSDLQVSGSHYKDMAIQPAEYSTKNKLGFLEGNIIKYVSRHGKKNGVDDLRKAIHSIELLIEYTYDGE